MIKKEITPRDVVDLLNNALRIDRRAIEGLFSVRIPCNKNMSYHPTIQVIQMNENFSIFGILGILNGLFGIDSDGWGCICADLEDGNIKIKGFRLLTEKDKPKKGGE